MFLKCISSLYYVTDWLTSRLDKMKCVGKLNLFTNQNLIWNGAWNISAVFLLVSIKSLIVFYCLGAMYGGGSDLFFSQFDLHTRDQKVSQIVLLEVIIYSDKLLYCMILSVGGRMSECFCTSYTNIDCLGFDDAFINIPWRYSCLILALKQFPLAQLKQRLIRFCH